jgi:hypothetical protein
VQKKRVLETPTIAGQAQERHGRSGHRRFRAGGVRFDAAARAVSRARPAVAGFAAFRTEPVGRALFGAGRVAAFPLAAFAGATGLPLRPDLPLRVGDSAFDAEAGLPEAGLVAPPAEVRFTALSLAARGEAAGLGALGDR